MQKVVRHGTVIGIVEPEIRKETGIKRNPGTGCRQHDTASAVAACPLSSESAAYISSGTWSLMGIESKKPIISEKAFKYNFTNERRDLRYLPRAEKYLGIVAAAGI